MRKASIKRTTKETAIEVAVDLDGSGNSSVSTRHRPTFVQRWTHR